MRLVVSEAGFAFDKLTSSLLKDIVTLEMTQRLEPEGDTNQNGMGLFQYDQVI